MRIRLNLSIWLESGNEQNYEDESRLKSWSNILSTSTRF